MQYEYKNINGQSVAMWWYHKLDTRRSFPPCAVSPTVASMRRQGGYNLGWLQEAAYDYMEISYYSFCSKENFEALCKEDFHTVFLSLFTEHYYPRVIVYKCYGPREFIDSEKVGDNEFLDVEHYKLPSIYFSRALFEMSTGLSPQWRDGRRMKPDYLNSRAFWKELFEDKYYNDDYPTYGDSEYVPYYIKKVHKSKLD